MESRRYFLEVPSRSVGHWSTGDRPGRVIARSANHAEVAKRLASLGASAIITDDPGRMTSEP